ncbi:MULTISPECIES: exonuclease domain-containing protein [unclassified Fusibacter]|uniref:exonuclease domain-containing protein n=1 Tax=unclassified Fusibacter TaxID=2624464 RepID=UPI00101386A5|nr:MULTISPECIES: exonuclease domain-containing protein [unclassified Fusibacter]MCK8058458.1 exonuclease domain-containing protein [Fusibacter sp. A2]NPE22774.1 hypothetical protein [Fusibacter sp. A1]RXV60331.1 hypothetical protein DWB64_13080 [Fusibacter sp. A1]
MKTFFMDLEFLCDEHDVYEDDIIAICILSEDDSYELLSFIHPEDDDYEVSDYCTDLTGISQNDLSDKPYFEDIYDQMLENIAQDDTIYVWGDTDLEAIYKASMQLADELEFNIVDFQTEFVEYCDYKFRPGLKKVYSALTDDDSAQHHDVRSDTLMLKEIYRIFHSDKKAAMRKVKSQLK